MWLVMSLGSALMLGIYDVAKKQALKHNGHLWVLFGAAALSAVFLCPCLSVGSTEDHLHLMLKSVIVTTSWISGIVGLKLLPITTVSTLKASRPFFVVLFSIILFGESLNPWQWGGVALALLSLVMLNGTSKHEGIHFLRRKGFYAMLISIMSGVASTLYDKHIMKDMEPLFVQSWSNVYIASLLAICTGVKALKDGSGRERFHPDWMIVIIAVFISVSDMLYFFSLKQDGALLSVISLIRRCSVVVTFVFGAMLFKEKRIREKGLGLAILLTGMGLLLYGSSI